MQTQMRRAGPRRFIVKHGVVDAAPGEPKHVLVLSCGHKVMRYLFRLQHRQMAQCWHCQRKPRGQKP